MTIAIALVIAMLYTTLVEYLVHRYFSHRRFSLFSWRPGVTEGLFLAHALGHHREYTGATDYVSTRAIPARDWVNDSLLAWSHVAVLPLYLLLVFYLGPISVLVAAAYTTFHFVIFFSILHHAQHHPHGKWWEYTSPIVAHNLHHWLHHRHQNRNFSVTIPIFDYLFFTKARPSAEERALFMTMMRTRLEGTAHARAVYGPTDADRENHRK